MAETRIRLFLTGLNSLMKSKEIRSALNEAADAVKRNAESLSGEPFATKTRTIKWIAVTNVYPDSEGAAHANYEDNVLEKAVSRTGLGRYNKKSARKNKK